MTEKSWTVYTLADSRSPSDVRYVGITSTTPARRMARHLSDRRQNHRTNWIGAVRREGADVVMTPLMDGLTEQEAKSKEVDLIASYREGGARLVNSTDGGDGTVGFSPTAETRAKMAAAASAAMTPEHRLRLSAIQKALVTPEVRERIGAAHRGKVMGEESRLKISEAMRKIAQLRPPRNGGFKGIHACGRKWQATIKADGVTSHLGTFPSPEDAARAYDSAALAAWGRDCYLNFGNELEQAA